MNRDQINERAWNLYRQLQNQRARLRTFRDTLAFVSVRQSEAPETIEPVAQSLWEISERMQGDMDPNWEAQS